VAVLAQRLREDVRAGGERRLDIAHAAALAAPDHVRPPLGMYEDVVGQGRVHPDHGRQRLVIHVDELDGILGLRPTVGDHHRYRVPYIPGDRSGERRHGELGAQIWQQISEGEHGAHPRRLSRTRPAHVDNARVGIGTAHEGGVKRPGLDHIVDVLAPPRHQPCVLAARQASADKPRRDGALVNGGHRRKSTDSPASRDSTPFGAGSEGRPLHWPGEASETVSSTPLSGVHGTAFSAAALRAWHTLVGGEPKIFCDDLALALTGMDEAQVVAFGQSVAAASASTATLRSRFTEDHLATAHDRLNQYVVLGAGLDSYALRMGRGLGNMTVFEVDDPPFQQWKRQRIHDLGLDPPSQLRFVPCDFESTSIAEALAASGFAADKACFISWLGVTQYLTRDAVTDTLRWAGERPKGSELVLTYLESSRAVNLRIGAAKSGIALLSDFTTSEMTAMVEAAGFSRIEHLSPEEAEERYFQGRSDGLRAPEIQRLLRAVV
jgi:methyltransferase (TIGR00027 family)